MAKCAGGMLGAGGGGNDQNMRTQGIKKSNKTNTRKYELLLLAVISARATSFIFSKMILQDISPFNLLAIRFLIAFCLLVILFHKETPKITKSVLISGVVIGFLFFVTMAFEMTALRQADSSLVSLLENCAIIFVPAFEIVLLRKIPNRVTVINTAIAMLGVVLLAMQQGELKGGFTFGLLAAMSYALAIIATDRLPQESDSTLSIGIIQVGIMGLMSLLSALLFEHPRLPQNGTQWFMLAILIVVCTGFGFTLQPVAQSHITAERAGIFCAVSPAIAALLGMSVLHERLGGLGWAGLILILTSIALPYLNFKAEKGQPD